MLGASGDARIFASCAKSYSLNLRQAQDDRDRVTLSLGVTLSSGVTLSLSKGDVDNSGQAW